MQRAASRAPATIGVAVAVLLGAVGPARAHHTAAPTGRAIDVWANAPPAWMRLAALRTALEAGGSLFSLELEGQVDFADRFAARMRAPFHWLSHDGDEQVGPGDLTLGGDAAFALGRLHLWLGTDVELPTGDAEAGLGHGAVTLAPIVTAQFEIGAGLRAHAQSSLLVDLTSRPAGAIDEVEQQDEVEFRVAGGALWERGSVAAGGLVRLSVPLSSDDPAGHYATFVVLSELALTRHLRGSLFAELPFGGDRRIDWRGGLAIGYGFSDR